MGEPTTPDDRNPRLSETDVRMLVDAIHQMAEFLGNPQAFTDAVRMKLSPLSDDWERILEMLPRDAVLASRDGAWHWLLDFSGRPLMPPPPGSRAPGPASISFSPPPGPASPVPETRSAISRIQTVQAAVRGYTDERLDLDKLAVELRLLEISPPYSAFETAAQNYLAGAGSRPGEAPYPSLDQDRAIIHEYWNLIERSSVAMKRSFFLAELMTTQYPGGRNARTRTYALRLLAEELDFAQRPLVQLETMLAAFEEDFAKSDSRALLTRREYAQIDPFPMTPNWIAALTNGVTERNWPELLSNDHIPDYFRRRLEALVRHMRNRAALSRLTLLDLLLRASDRVAPLHGEPDRLPLSRYAELLSQTVLPYPDIPSLEDFFLGLYVKLGFGPQVERRMRGLSNVGTDLAQDLLEAASLVLRGGERVLLIIGGATESPTPLGGLPRPPRQGSAAAAWTLSHRHAVLPMFRESLRDPLRHPVEFDISLVLCEGEAPDELRAGPWQSLVPPGVRIVEMAPPGTTRPALFITETRGLDEAVAEALKLFPPR